MPRQGWPPCPGVTLSKEPWVPATCTAALTDLGLDAPLFLRNEGGEALSPRPAKTLRLELEARGGRRVLLGPDQRRKTALRLARSMGQKGT